MKKRVKSCSITSLLVALLLLCACAQAAVAAPDPDAIATVPLEVVSFTFTQPDAESDRLEARFTITGGSGRYDYELSATVLEGGAPAGTRQLDSGSATLGENAVCSVSLSSLGSHTAYSLMLKVYKDYSGIEVSASAVADGTFGYTNPQMLAPVGGIDLEIDLINRFVRADWSSYRAWGADQYLFAVLDGSDEESFVELEAGETAYSMPFLPDADTVTIELSYRNGGRVSQTLSKTLDIKAADILTPEIGDVTAARQGKVRYQAAKATSVEIVTVLPDDPGAYDRNGALILPEAEKISISGDGFFSVNLQEYHNELTFRWSFDPDPPPENGRTWYVKKADVYVDLVAPLLRLPEHGVTVYTADESFVLAGVTEAGVTVTVGGAAATVADNGGFTHTVQLAMGDNRLEVAAADAAGNRAVQTVHIVRVARQAERLTAAGSGLWARFGALFISLAAAVLFVPLVFLLRKRFLRRWPEHRVSAFVNLARDVLAVPLALAVGYTVYTLIRYIPLARYIDSEAFATAALTDASGIYADVAAYQRAAAMFGLAWKLLLIFGILFAAAFVASLLIGRAGKKKPPAA